MSRPERELEFAQGRVLANEQLDPAIADGIRKMRIDRGRSYQEGPDGTVALWDLDLATYLMTSGGLDVVDIWREGSEFRIIFRTTPDKVRELHIRFLSSLEGRFATGLKLLKKAAHSIGARPPAPPRR